MPQSFALNLVHLVFSTKGRQRFLTPEINPELWAYQAVVLNELLSPAVVIGGHEDHVHILFRLSKSHTLIKVIEEVKKSSSKWLKTKGHAWTNFYWQGGYGAFSISPSNMARVRRYIEQQEKHHQRMSFQDE
jgi:REP element-mobilizing transposase RayT